MQTSSDPVDLGGDLGVECPAILFGPHQTGIAGRIAGGQIGDEPVEVGLLLAKSLDPLRRRHLGQPVKTAATLSDALNLFVAGQARDDLALGLR